MKPFLISILLEPSDIGVTERKETRVRESVFGRVNYAYNDRYLASVSLRRDGDSRFGANNRYETFPALICRMEYSQRGFLRK